VLVTASLAGTTYSVGQSAEELVNLIQNPEQLLEIVDLAKQISENPELVAQIPGAMVNSVQSTQNRQNMFSDRGDETLIRGDSDNVTFARGWYSGYVVGWIASAVVGDKVKAGTLSKIADRSSTVRSGLNAYRGARAVAADKTVGVAQRAALRRARGVARRTPDFEASRLRAGLGGLSVARQRAVTRLLENTVTSRTRGVIADAELESRAARYLGATGERGARLLNRMDSEGVRDLLRMGGCRRGAAGFGTAAAATATAGGCDFDPEEVPDDAWTRIIRIDDLDARQAEAAGAKYQQFASQRNGGDWIEILEPTGENGLRLADELDAADVGTMRRLLDSGDMDSADTKRMAEMLETKTDDPRIGDDVEASNILNIADSGGDISETIGVVSPENVGRVDGKRVDNAWLERGCVGREADNSDEWRRDDAGAGWAHIRHNHMNKNGRTNEFKRYGDSYENPERVQRLIMEAIENGNPRVIPRSDGRDDLFYVYEVPNSGGETVSVLVGNNGFTVTAIPGERT
jgi:hypothetical protein